MREEKRTRIFGFVSFFIITLFILYPQPTDLFKSVYRIFNPPVDPYLEEIAKLSSMIESDSLEQIESFVKYIFPYYYDWETYRVPWYFPTPEEAIEKRRGDCKTRMIITASILEYREEDYSFNASPTHIWVDYIGKKSNLSENENVAFFSSGEGTSFTRPEIDVRRSADLFWKAFWEHMPQDKKASLFLGLLFSSTFVLFPSRLSLPSRFNHQKKVE